MAPKIYLASFTNITNDTNHTCHVFWQTDALWHLLPANCSGGGATLSQVGPAHTCCCTCLLLRCLNVYLFQPTTVLQNLSRLCCLQQLQVTWPHFKHDQSHLIKLSRDLLQHMVSVCAVIGHSRGNGVVQANSVCVFVCMPVR